MAIEWRKVPYSDGERCFDKATGQLLGDLDQEYGGLWKASCSLIRDGCGTLVGTFDTRDHAAEAIERKIGEIRKQKTKPREWSTTPAEIERRRAHGRKIGGYHAKKTGKQA